MARKQSQEQLQTITPIPTVRWKIRSDEELGLPEGEISITAVVTESGEPLVSAAYARVGSPSGAITSHTFDGGALIVDRDRETKELRGVEALAGDFGDVREFAQYVQKSRDAQLLQVAAKVVAEWRLFQVYLSAIRQLSATRDQLLANLQDAESSYLKARERLDRLTSGWAADIPLHLLNDETGRSTMAAQA